MAAALLDQRERLRQRVQQASSGYRRWNRLDLLRAESVSMKGRNDWHATKNVAQRVKYIESVLALDGLQGRVFYAHWWASENARRQPV
jgi:hypothetical protein